MISYTITKGVITVVLDGKYTTVKAGAVNFNLLRDALIRDDLDAVKKNLSVKAALTNWAKGRFSMTLGTLTFDGDPVDPVLFSRIQDMAGRGEDPGPLLKFWERLQANPSKRSVDQLWKFLENQGIPLTSDGHFLAYKSVRSDWKDHHSNSIENRVGKEIVMPRNKISDDPNHACHEGLHVGALAYAGTFGGGDSIIIICKVDPADVVCVPFDHSHQKMRVCRYQIVGVHDGNLMPSTTIDDEDLPEPPKVDKKRPKWMQRLDALDDAGLMSENMDDLRRYASQGLSIVGASRLSGGKLALVAAISKARR